MKKIFKTQADLESFGEQLGRLLLPGDVVALNGDVGVGKTTLVKSVVRGINPKEVSNVSSPTFSKLQSYGQDPIIHHMDFYQIKTIQALQALGFHEVLGAEGIVLIEWFDLFPEFYSGGILEIKLSFYGDDARIMTMQGEGQMIKRMKSLTGAVCF